MAGYVIVRHQLFEDRPAVLMTCQDEDAARAAAMWFWRRGIRVAMVPAARADHWRRLPSCSDRAPMYRYHNGRPRRPATSTASTTQRGGSRHGG
jgi:hypothetical protein